MNLPKENFLQLITPEAAVDNDAATRDDNDAVAVPLLTVRQNNRNCG